MQMERKAPFQNKYMLGRKTYLSKINKTEIIPVIFSDYSGIQLKNQQNGENLKIYKYVEIKQHTSNQPGVGQKIHATTPKIKGKSENIMKETNMKTQHIPHSMTFVWNLKKPNCRN